MNTLTRVLLGCACLGSTFFLSGCATTAPWQGIPQGEPLPVVFEIHGYDRIGYYFRNYSSDCLVHAGRTEKFEDLKHGQTVVVRKDDGGTDLKVFGVDQISREEYVTTAGSMYMFLTKEKLPESLWGEPEDHPAGTVRALTITYGKSMLLTYPEKAIVAVVLGYPYGKLKEGQPIVFWNVDHNLYTYHHLVARFGDRWTTQGSNNTGLPYRMTVSSQGGAANPVITQTTWSKSTLDRTPVNPLTYVGTVHRVWQDLTPPKPPVLVASR